MLLVVYESIYVAITVNRPNYFPIGVTKKESEESNDSEEATESEEETSED